MNISDSQLKTIYCSDPSLKQQLMLINGFVGLAGWLGTAFAKALSVRLPFLAHSAYSIVR